MAQAARVAVVGGGLGGLVAAAFAARAGAQVTLFERMADTGGRARSREERGFTFNMGPHALYQKGPAIEALRELGIEPAGKSPQTSGALGYVDGRLHALPGGAVSLLTTGMLGLSEKLELGGLMSRVPKLVAEASPTVSIGAFLAEKVRSARVRELLLALVRLTTYSHLPDVMPSDAAMAQVALGLGAGVRYLDGGWQTLVDALQAKAVAAGVALRRAARVVRVVHDGAARGVELHGGEVVDADAVILALGPDEASELVDAGRHPFFARALAARIPVRAACLDLALSRLPNPSRSLALGIDRPLYASVHSNAAVLGPPGTANIALARYLASDEHPERAELEREFERVLDLWQPGWRELEVTRKLMRDLVVTHDLPQAARGGLASRTPGQVTGIANLWLAGDWVGPTALLADAAFASARIAAQGAAGARGVRVAA